MIDMHTVMVAGAGKIGSLITFLLATNRQYRVHVVDHHLNGSDLRRVLAKNPKIQTAQLNVQDTDQLLHYLQIHQISTIISSLPYSLNHSIAEVARRATVHYFDLTEDVETTNAIKKLAVDATTVFVPQCGLAPGFIGIAANHLMQSFEHCESVKLRVGALPQRVSNALHYALTWSTEGLINEYSNPCEGMKQGQRVFFSPLDGLEHIELDGCRYEAFHTSGGLGGLIDSLNVPVDALDYKTIRYPGHCDKIRFLLQDMQLQHDRIQLKHLLERALPKTDQDVVILYISITGKLGGEYCERSYQHKLYPQEIHGLTWSAIQLGTASSACAMVDLILNQPQKKTGFLLQEQMDFNAFLTNPFGRYFKSELTQWML